MVKCSFQTATGRLMRCFLKVTMADRASADRACKDPNPIIDGRKANVNLAYLGAKPRVIQPGKSVCLNRELQKY